MSETNHGSQFPPVRAPVSAPQPDPASEGWTTPSGYVVPHETVALAAVRENERLRAEVARLRAENAADKRLAITEQMIDAGVAAYRAAASTLDLAWMSKTPTHRLAQRVRLLARAAT